MTRSSGDSIISRDCGVEISGVNLVNSKSCVLRSICAMALFVVAGLVLGSSSVEAAVPGQNGNLLVGATLSEGPSAGGLFEVGLDGSAVQVQPDDLTIYGGAISPNGELVAFSKNPGDQVWMGSRSLLDAGDSGALTRISFGVPSAQDPVFAPDGRSIFYSAFLYNSGFGPEMWEIRRYWIKSKTTQVLVNEFPTRGVSPVPSVSPNGQLISFTYESGTGLKIRILRLSDRSTWDLPVEGNAKFGDFSPDGKRVAYIGNASGAWNLSVTNLDGSGAKALALGDGIPAFSPDGTMIGFTRGFSEGEEQLVILRLKDGRSSMLSIPGVAWQVWDWPRERAFKFTRYVARLHEVRVRVFGPGLISVAGKGIASQTKKVSRRGTYRLRLKPSGRRRSTSLRISFHPAGGLSTTKMVRINRLF